MKVIQAKMISDDVALDAVRACLPSWGTATFWNIRDYFDTLGVSFPEKVIREKMCRLVERGLLLGCEGRHNCRGDFEINHQGTT